MESAEAGRAPAQVPATAPAASDEEVVRRVVAGERALFEVLMRRYNQRVYRTVRAVLRDEQEAEDAMQQVYLHAYAHLADFEGTAAFGTWLTRIALNEAMGRTRRRARLVALAAACDAPRAAPPEDPEESAARREARDLVERSIDGLAPAHRLVLMLKDVEQLPTAEVAAALGLREDAVRARLARARRALRERLEAALSGGAPGAFSFGAARCDRVVARVLAALPA